MKAKILGLLAVGLLAGPIAGHAGVIYTLSSVQGSFSYTSSGFVASTIYQCNAFGGTLCGPSLNLIPDVTEISGLTDDLYDVAEIASVFSNGSGFSRYIFANGAFGAFGTYEALTGFAGTLVVRSDSSVPEPGTLALLGLGLAGLGLSRRRKAN